MLTPFLSLLLAADPAPAAVPSPAVPPAAVAPAPPSAVQSPAAAPALDTAKPAPSAELLVGLSGGFRPDVVTGGGVGWAGFTYALTPVFRLEVAAGLGAYPITEDMLTPIRIGFHIEYPREGIVPYLWLALAHNHETKFADVARNPIPTVLGLSEDGVVHRTGIDAGLGVHQDIPVIFPTVMRDAVHFRAGLRLSFTALLGAGPPRSLDLLGTLGVLF